ncbi:hypothetical protein [Streptomyces fradiae]|uniref:hypothetical protein n=1 Tax=Streptomyces fradiae TaxID=1906 RepID=UPI0036596299
MFVAATRARDELIVTWSGDAGRFLPEHADDTAHRAGSAGERRPAVGLVVGSVRLRRRLSAPTARR